MALALINALNHKAALSLPEDRKNDILFDLLDIGRGTRVAMVGYFRPLLVRLKDRGAEVDVVDTGRQIGDGHAFRDKLAHWAEALIITSTAILNDTADDLLAAAGPRIRGAMLGPSTPLIAAPFAGHPVKVLAGTVPLNRDEILRAIRHGKGTPALQKHSRKAYLVLER
jgi:uncharacterized protein (DUF4213/DUF364 family)